MAWSTSGTRGSVQCLLNVPEDPKKKKKKRKKLSPISLKNLAGAFVVLSVGLSLSLLAFLGEKIVSRREQFRIRKD
jgi:hypothetical protein